MISLYHTAFFIREKIHNKQRKLKNPDENKCYGGVLNEGEEHLKYWRRAYHSCGIANKVTFEQKDKEKGRTGQADTHIMRIWDKANSNA